MTTWLVADSLYCPEQFFCSHLDSYSHYLREAGEMVFIKCLSPGMAGNCGDRSVGFRDLWWHDNACRDAGRCVYGENAEFLFALDKYDVMGAAPGFKKRIAQVAALVSPMPWKVRNADGSPAFDLIVSSIPWMVEEARAAGCRAELMPLAFDTRTRVCGMGVKRDLDCIFIGTTGPNHKRRTELLGELSDVVTVLPPVFGRKMFRTLARARVVFSAHAEWARGTANCMRLFESAGVGAAIVSDGIRPDVSEWPRPFHFFYTNAKEARDHILWLLSDDSRVKREIEACTEEVLRAHTYESRIPQLLEWARSL